MDFTVKHDESNHRFYADVSGKTAELKYKKADEKALDYYSTYVPPSLRNQGIAGQITQQALDYARENDFEIIPSCPYVKEYIDRHSEYADLIKS